MKSLIVQLIMIVKSIKVAAREGEVALDVEEEEEEEVAEVERIVFATDVTG